MIIKNIFPRNIIKMNWNETKETINSIENKLTDKEKESIVSLSQFSFSFGMVFMLMIFLISSIIETILF